MKFFLVALAICIATVIAALLFLQTAAVCGESPKYSRTRNTIKGIELACQKYKEDYSINPAATENSLTSALTGSNPKNVIYISEEEAPMENGKFVDAWHTPIRYVRSASYEFTFRSAGKDKIFETRDDIVNE